MCPLLSGVLYLGIHCTIQQSMVKRIVLDFCLEYFVEFQSKTYANTCMASSWLKSSCVPKSDEQLSKSNTLLASITHCGSKVACTWQCEKTTLHNDICALAGVVAMVTQRS